MSKMEPQLFPDELKGMDYWTLKDWKARIARYRTDGCHCVEQLHQGRMYRVGIFNRRGSLVRFFYDRQARICVTLWHMAAHHRGVKSKRR